MELVYCLINPCYENMVKIGRTERTIEERLYEMNRATGLLTKYKCIYYIEVKDCQIVEKNIHYKHDKTRIITSQEFFKGSPSDYIETFKIYGNPKQYIKLDKEKTMNKTSDSILKAQRKYYKKEEVRQRKREQSKKRYMEKKKIQYAIKVNKIIDKYEELTENSKQIFDDNCKYNFTLKNKGNNKLEDIVIGFIKIILFMCIQLFTNIIQTIFSINKYTNLDHIKLDHIKLDHINWTI